jgi:hypothetical protein
VHIQRIHKVLFAVIVLGGLYWFGLRTDPRVDALNQALEMGNPAIRSYPYTFRVLRLEGEAAVVGTPRSPDVPVYRMIGAIYPNLAGRAANDPDFVAAEKELAQIQSESRQIILDQPGVASVKWELDRNWLIAHYIQIH